jgi:hypothetical protein
MPLSPLVQLVASLIRQPSLDAATFAMACLALEHLLALRSNFEVAIQSNVRSE